MATTKIWCLLIDHNNELKANPFRVSIPIDPDFLVDDLKKAIKAEPTVRYLSEVDLSVWRCEDRNFLTVSDAKDTERDRKLAALDFGDGTVVEKLAEEHVVESLQILKNEILIVRIPAPHPISQLPVLPPMTTTTMATTKIWCLLIDHNNELQLDPFRVSVPIDPDFLVDDLKNAIKVERSPKLNHLSASELSVWRCEDRNFLTDAKDTERDRKLAALDFDDETVVEKLTEELVVEDLKIANNERLIVRIPEPPEVEDAEEAQNTVLPLKRKSKSKTAIDFRDANLSVLSKTHMSVTSASDVLEVNKRLCIGAFEDHYAHNVAIFHPALATLQRRIDALESQIDTGYDWPKNPESETPTRFTTQFLHLAQTYFDQSRAFYATEEALAEKLILLLDQVLMLKASTEKYSSTTIGKKKGSFKKGDNRVDCSWGPFSHVIAEFKLLFGHEGDASVQGGLWYGKHCNAVKAGATLKYSKMPVVILGIMGPVLELSIGVCLEHVVVDIILHLRLRSSVNDDRTVFKLALIFSALKECSDSLFAEYKNSLIIPPKDPATYTWQLPRPSAVIPSKNSRVGDVKFEGKLDRENKPLAAHEGSLQAWEMRPLYLAKNVVENEEVIVKFTTRYNKDAHTILSALDYAPKLHFTEEVVGGQTMVVMERLKGRPMSARIPKSLPPRVFDDIEEALKVLHAKSIVFGDLRDANVIIVKERAKLVDFDWPAIEGEGLYPVHVNKFLFDDDVEGFGLMRKKHDWYGLMRLINVYCNDAKYTTDKCSQLEAMRR